MRTTIIAAILMTACTADPTLTGEAQPDVHAPITPATTTPGARPAPDPCACDGEYLVDNTVLRCVDGVDGTRVKLMCMDDGSVSVRIGPVTLHGEHTGDGLIVAMGESGCASAVLTADVSDCSRVTGDWYAVGCGCEEDWPMLAIRVP